MKPSQLLIVLHVKVLFLGHASRMIPVGFPVAHIPCPGVLRLCKSAGFLLGWVVLKVVVLAYSVIGPNHWP